MTLETVGQRVKWARKRAGLSQLELRLQAGLSQSTLSGLERGKQASTAKLPLIAKVCGVNALWLQSGYGSPDDGVLPGDALDADDRAILTELGARVRRERENAQMTVAQLARRISTPAEIAAIESGRHWPGPVLLMLLADRLHTSLDWLVAGMMSDEFKSARKDRDLGRTLHDIARPTTRADEPPNREPK